MEVRASTTEVAEGVDTSIALVNLIKAKCKGYRMDLNIPSCLELPPYFRGSKHPRKDWRDCMRMPFIMENFDERYMN
jgi:glycerol-3-phosphate dehydrogenase (NAD+)